MVVVVVVVVVPGLVHLKTLEAESVPSELVIVKVYSANSTANLDSGMVYLYPIIIGERILNTAV